VTILRQCELLDLCRSSVYYQPKPPSARELMLMRRIDELHLNYPFFGARRIAEMLKREGFEVGRVHVGTLMTGMGIEAIYRKKRTSIPATGHKIYPYLLREVSIERPNQAWAADITYLPMAQGFAYLVAIVELYSRKVLAWRVSNAMSSEFCVQALNEALQRFGQPEIFNTDQGSQFTDCEFTAPLIERGIGVSMDGKGRWIDNVFVERLWRSVKYELVYLHAHESIRELKAALAEYFEFFNATRPHQSLGYRTPDEVYFERGADHTGPQSARDARHSASDRISGRARRAPGAVEANTEHPQDEKTTKSPPRTRPARKTPPSVFPRSNTSIRCGGASNFTHDKPRKAA
jgi:putative transposase